jgi:hypothetical protein
MRNTRANRTPSTTDARRKVHRRRKRWRTSASVRRLVCYAAIRIAFLVIRWLLERH